MSGEVKNSLSDGKIYLLMLREVKNSLLKITVRLSNISSKKYNIITFEGLKMPHTWLGPADVFDEMGVNKLLG